MNRGEASPDRLRGIDLGRMSPLLWAGIWGFVLCGCAEAPIEGSAENREAASLEHGLHIVVPFFPDDTDQCGPATLASVMAYWGIPSNPQMLKEEIYLPRLGGTLPIDLLLAAQAHGLQGEFYGGSLDNVRTELKARHPLVAFLNLGYTIFPRGHYVVITGFDDERQGVYVHSGLERDTFLPYAEFLPSWEKTGRWTLLVLPGTSPGRTHT